MKRVIALILVLAMVLLPACSKADRWEEAVDRGRKHMRDDDFEEAIRAFWEAIKLDPKRPEAYKYRGDAYLQAAWEALKDGDTEEAEDYLEEAEDDYDKAEDLDYEDEDELEKCREEAELLEEEIDAYDVGPADRPAEEDDWELTEDWNEETVLRRKERYRDYFYTRFDDNDYVVLADVTGDGAEEMLVVHLEDPDGFEITGHVYTLQNDTVTEIYTNRGSSVHAGGFYGWYLVERDGGYCLGEEGFGMWQGVGILSFTQYIPAADGSREVVEELILNSEDEGNHDEYGMVTQEAYFAYTEQLNDIMAHSYCLYATASESGYGQWIETFPPVVFGTMDDAPMGMDEETVGVKDVYVEVYESPFGGSDYCCHIPAFVLSDERCAIMNEQIYQDLSRIMGEYPFDVEGYEGQPSVGICHSMGAACGIASLVAQVVVQHSDFWYYRTYNMNIATGWEATDQEVVKAFGYSDEEFWALRQQAVEAFFKDFYENALDYMTQEEYDELWIMTTCEENLRTARPFVDEAGRLCLVVDIYSYAGAAYYPYRICLEGDSYEATPLFLSCEQHG